MQKGGPGGPGHWVLLCLSRNMAGPSSYSAFNDVDETVAKAVLGSDGAARWQDFKSTSKLKPTSSVAPAIPLKKLDRALGTTSINDERKIEAKVRADAGTAALGSGYTQFKRKTDMEEVAERKRRKLVLSRTRPKDERYFLDVSVFEGHKHDYVFTTRDRGTGYYWDGNDSIRKELGQPPIASLGVGGVVAPSEDETGTAIDTSDAPAPGNVTKSKKKKKKKKAKAELPFYNPHEDDDPFNPMAQVAQAIKRRNEILGRAPTLAAQADHSNTRLDASVLGASIRLPSSSVTSSAPSVESSAILEPSLSSEGWESAVDASSGKTYFFNRKTNERTWTKPEPSMEDNAALPEGWNAATDKASGKVYYYHTNGNTAWTKPT